LNSNHNERNNGDNINDKITRFGAVLIAIASVVFCYSYTRLSGSSGIVAYAVAGVLAVAGAFIITVVVLGSRFENRNLFLYDPKSKRDVTPSELSIALVRQRVISYMKMFRRFGMLYIGELFDSPSVPESLKPLFCYELLCEIAEDGEAKAETFLNYGSECAAIFSKYLTDVEEFDILTRLSGFISDFSERREVVNEFIGYLRSQKDHMGKRMLNYTVNNIDKF
jgi:hypothetical protein